MRIFSTNHCAKKKLLERRLLCCIQLAFISSVSSNPVLLRETTATNLLLEWFLKLNSTITKNISTLEDGLPERGSYSPPWLRVLRGDSYDMQAFIYFLLRFFLDRQAYILMHLKIVIASKHLQSFLSHQGLML